jgi:hypothetical protein
VDARKAGSFRTTGGGAGLEGRFGTNGREEAGGEVGEARAWEGDVFIMRCHADRLC